MDKTATKIKRNIVKIDEEKCDGCGLCVTSCAEGALKVIDGKARLVSEIYCDGLAACLGECPQGAISIEEREAAPFDEEAALKHVAAEKVKEEKTCGCPGTAVHEFKHDDKLPCGCPSSAVTQFRETKPTSQDQPVTVHKESELAHWPVQLTLVPTRAPFLQGADVLLAADCSAFSYGGFHGDFLRDRALLVACPKLDNYEAHLAKLGEILKQSDVRSLTVLRMEVPCCSGLTRMAMQAILSSDKDIPFRETIIGIRGEVKQ